MPLSFDYNKSKGTSSDAPKSAEGWQQTIKTLVKSVRHGSVRIAIQHGKLIQIAHTETIRFDQPKSEGGSGKKLTSSSGK